MTRLRFGYNTNGFAHHSLGDALRVLEHLGYRSVALTLDHNVLNPLDPKQSSSGQVKKWAAAFAGRKLTGVVETGARFLLDPFRKHQPTLLSKRTRDRALRQWFLKRACDIADQIGWDTVSVWSGTADSSDSASKLMTRFVDTCRVVCDHAAVKGVRVAFEPEPGMFIETMDQYAELFDRIDHPAFGLTMDIGHLHCLGELPIEHHIRDWRDRLWNVHIEDMKRGVHDHLMFGEGEIDFAPVLRTLQEIGYAGGVHVELSRHSHDAVETAKRALAFLKRW